MVRVTVISGPYTFPGHFEEKPKSVAAFRKPMPFASKTIHAVGCGEVVRIPVGEMDFGVGFKNNTCYPAPARPSSIPAG
jgi:Protein of unknown function (DUF3830)